MVQSYVIIVPRDRAWKAREFLNLFDATREIKNVDRVLGCLRIQTQKW